MQAFSDAVSPELEETMLEIYLCKTCGKYALVSRTSHRKDGDICRACGSKMQLSDLTYEQWIRLSPKEREAWVQKESLAGMEKKNG